MIHWSPTRAAAALSLILAGACTTSQRGSMPAGDSAAPGSLNADQRAAGWRMLADGNDASQWRGYKSQTLPDGWRISNGTLSKSTVTGDIITKDKFANFELAFDWMISPGGNAGLFYRGTEEYDHIYWSAPEYQILDDSGHVDGKNRLTSAGAAYGLYPAPTGVVKPANQWNSTLLVVQGGRVQHWLNGQKLLEYELGGADWAAKVKASKFNDYPNYGKATSGHIGFQGDHEGTLTLRNIRIRVLP